MDNGRWLMGWFHYFFHHPLLQVWITVAVMAGGVLAERSSLYAEELSGQLRCLDLLVMDLGLEIIILHIKSVDVLAFAYK